METSDDQSNAHWNCAYTDVNRWRGECLHHCSTAESAVTKTLIALSEACQGGQKVALRHLIGQRFEDLSSAIGPQGPFAEIGKSAHKALATYREKHEEFRTHLCHGVMEVLLDRSRDWTVIVTNLAITGKRANQTVQLLRQKDAEEKLAALKFDTKRLAATLGQVRSQLRQVVSVAQN